MTHDKQEVVATIAQRERLILAPYAVHSVDSAGRKHREVEHPYRGPFQRDRDRILHCAAFRRLAGKMQVFTGDRGDYHRTRLTHTMEVASIARTMGRALRLNEDLIEALALLHDIGHPPFGHAGEDALDECLSSVGGFSHNRHALVIVEELEIRYTDFPGLNLSREVLASQSWRAEKSDRERMPLLETQVVDAADSIAYMAHDTDDALKLGLVTLDELADAPLIGVILARAKEMSSPMLRMNVVHTLIDQQVGDLLHATATRLAGRAPTSSEEACRLGCLVAPSDELAADMAELREFLYERVYRHPDLVKVRAIAVQQLHRMFEELVQHGEQLPEASRARIEIVGVERAVGDYLAGMTDRFCREQYERIEALDSR